MNLGELARYKGVLVATFVLVLLVVLSALVSSGLQSKARTSTAILERVTALEWLSPADQGLTSTTSVDEWEKKFQPAELSWLNSVAASPLANLKSAITAGDNEAYSKALAELTGLVANEDNKRNRLLKIAPIAVSLIAGMIFLLAVIPQLLRLSKDKEVQVESNQQAENILNTVSEGLFLLDKEGQIGVEQSKSLKQMFRMERDLEGGFLDFIGQYVPDSSVSVAKDYLDLLYGDRVKEKLVKDLNPLNQVEITITRRDGSNESRYLDFKFARVMVDGELQHLLGSVTDVTREVVLEKELQSNKEEQEAQLDLLMNILHLDKDSLSRFYSESEAALNEINNTLQERGSSSSQIRSKLGVIAEQAHRIKGDAAALKLHNFEFIVHEFESAIADVQAMPGNVTGRDVLPAVTKLKLVFKELNSMQSIVTRFSEVLKVERSAGSAPTAEGPIVVENTQASTAQVGSSLENELDQLVTTLSERNNVRVVLKTFGLGDGDVPEELAKVVRDASIQLLRNCVTHGAKPPEYRLAQSKPDYMTAVVSLTKTDEGHTLIVRDDGDGLDQERILQKAVEKGLLKAMPEGEVSQAGIGKIIFHSGFSTKDDVDLDSGRGVGLSAVLSMVNDAGGAIGLAQAKNKYCQFSVRFNK
ncbi:hypothetical protein NBRC116583_28570 [Arenicella sp. 4NH20-0111]|uniref:ATP-binding protein n=1 Tax=Arenicella sp. 4NH20-0111 TaxID=3127648 RepID=UPI0031089961